MLTTCISVSANTINQSNWHELVNFVAMRRRNPFVAVASRVYMTVREPGARGATATGASGPGKDRVTNKGRGTRSAAQPKASFA